MSILFVSDIHLDPSNQHLTGKFIRFLEIKASKAEALYLLGDIFETWVGDDHTSSWHNMIKVALKQLTSQGISVFFLHGNRDFLVGKKFFNETACQYLADSTLVRLKNKNILLLHGDTLCLDDHSYLWFRRFNRNFFIKRLFLSLPLTYRKQLANKIRHKSQAKNTQLLDITASEIPRLMSLYQADILIHGHTHRPAIHYLNLNTKPLLHIVLSDWHEEGNVLEMDDAGKIRLSYF